MRAQQKNAADSTGKHLASFPELNPNPVIELDRSGHIVFANLAAKKSLKKSGLGNNLDFFIPSDIKEILKKLREKKSQQFLREIVIGKNIFLSSIHTVPKLGTVRIYATDATERVNAQRALQTVNQELEERVAQRTEELTHYNRTVSMLSACNITLVRASKKEKLLHDICNILVKTGGYAMAWVGEPSQDDKKSVAPIAHVGFEEGYLEKAAISWSEKTLHGNGPTGRAIRERKVHIGRYLSSDPTLAPWRAEAAARNFASSIALPLIIKNNLLGVLTIYSQDPKAFDEREVALLQELADDLAYGIFSLEAYQSHEKARKYLLATNNLLMISNQSNSKQAYLDHVVSYIKKVSRCTHIGIRILDQDGFIPYGSQSGFSHDFCQSESRLSLDKDNCICVRVVSGKRDEKDAPVTTKLGSFYTGNSAKYIANLGGDCQKRFRGKCVRCGFASIAAVPIRAKDQIVGAIHLADKKTDALSKEKIEFIEALTPLIGEGIKKFQAADGVRESERKYRELVENAASLIIRLNTKGEVVFFNEFAEKFFGYRKEEIIGKKSVGTIIPETESSGRNMEVMLKDIIKNPEKYTKNENENIKKSGERVWVVWRNKALYNKQGKIEGILSVGNDITQRKAKEKELIESYQHMGIINRKISFLAELNQLTTMHRNRKKIISERMLYPLVNFTAADIGVLFKHDEEKGKTFQVLASANGEDYASASLKAISKNTCKILQTLARSKSCLRESCDNSLLGKLHFDKKLKYYMLLPFNWEGQLKAFIFLGFKEEKDFSNQDLEFFDVFSSYAASLLANTKVFK